MSRFISLVFFFLTNTFISESYVWNLGECVVYYNEPCNQEVMQFYLFTKFGRRSSVTLLDPFKPQLPSHLLTGEEFKIVIHGYGGLSMDYAIRNVTSAYKELGTNVILGVVLLVFFSVIVFLISYTSAKVDWSAIGGVPCYPTAYFNTWHVGQCTAVLSVSLAKLGFRPQNFHVIGFSLGAHIASFASNHLQKALGITYRRITGLDPALPFFATIRNEWKLDPSDAPFVDVIHTSAGSFGKLEAVGHVDFYINGGTLQPNCINRNYPQLCSHLMAGYFYASSIRNKKHYGFPCASILHYTLRLCSLVDMGSNTTKVLMGEHVNAKARGIYFVEIPTNEFHIRERKLSSLNYL